MSRKYVLILEEDSKHKITVSSENTGFNSLELLGLFSFKYKDICDQLQDKIKPDIIERKIIKEKK